MSKPFADGGAAEVQRLVLLWEQHSSRKFSPRDGMQPSNAVQIWAFAHHATRLSRAVLALHEAGLDLEAMPLIRQSLELAMNAAWLLISEDGGAALSAVDTKNRRVMFTEVTDLGLADLSAVRDALDAEEARNEQTITKTRSFQERCNAVSGGAQIYAMWRTLSLYSHATSSVADVYVQAAPEDKASPHSIKLRLRGDWGQGETWIRVQALVLLLAQIAADDAQRENPSRAKLDAARRRLGVEWKIRPSEAE